MMTAGGRDQSGPYPTRDEYDIAMARWRESIWDAEIRSGMLAYDNMGICRFGGANLYVSIYKVGDWMLRCFCSKPNRQIPADIQERYRAIDRFCRAYAQRVSALVPVTYLEQGITVGMRVLPIVKMPFLSGCPSLGEFLIDTYNERATMQQLCNAWLRMMHELEAASMAHGDLDLTNVFVQQQGASITLKLIDYDNTWIPELAGRSQTEYGHSNFQHPYFLPPRQRPFNVEMDRFSALVIYISLKTLVTHPHLYEEWGADESDRLLLSESDFQNAGLDGSRLRELRSLSSPDLHPYIDELSSSLREARMPRSLFDIGYQPQPPPQAMPYQRPLEPLAPPTPRGPARAMWSNAVYNANTVFNSPPMPSHLAAPPSPSVQPLAQPWNGGAGAGMLSTTPWRPIGAYQHADADVGRQSTSSWAAQTPNSAWSSNPGNSQVYPPPQAWMTGSNGMATARDRQYNIPSPLPQPWNTGEAHPPQAQMPFQPWNTGWANPQQAPSPSQFWNTGTSAPPPTPFPPTLNEDDDSLLLPLSGSNVSGGRQRVLIIAAICFLVLFILAAAITLALIFTGYIHMADTAPLMSQAWLRCVVQGGCYVAANT